MQKHILILIMCVVFSINALSQNIGESSVSDSTKKAYSYGLQYYFVNGILFAFKFNTHFPGVWRLKLDFSGSIADLSSTTERFNSVNEVTDEDEHNSDNRNFDIALTFEYNYFFPVHKRLKPYVGLGPVFSYSYVDNRSENKSDTPSISYHLTEYTTKNYGIGLIAVGGIESELIDFVSFFLEYNLTYMYFLQRSEYHQYSPENYLQSRYKTTGHQYVFSLSSVKIGIIVFF